MNLPAFLPLQSALPLLPAQPGSYALRLGLEQSTRLQIGQLGEFDLPAGVYIYCGSAFGPGGIRARVLRHARAGGKLHWHIDALRGAATLEGITWKVEARAECAWSQYLATLPSATIPIPGFGASDCRAGCPAHLILIRSSPRAFSKSKAL